MKVSKREAEILTQLILQNNLDFVERDGTQELSAQEMQFLELDAAQNAIRCLVIKRAVQDLMNVRGGDDPARALKVLEIGIGYGYVTTCLHWSFGDAVELYAVEHPQRRYINSLAFREYLAERDIDFQTIDLLHQDIPWDGLQFDVIVFSEVIEHMPPTVVPNLMKQLASRLCCGGRLVITSNNLNAFNRRVYIALHKGTIFEMPVPLDYASGTYGHIMFYGRNEMLRLMHHADLAVLKFEYLNWDYFYLPRDTWKTRFIYWGQKTLPSFFPSLASSWVLTAVRA